MPSTNRMKRKREEENEKQAAKCRKLLSFFQRHQVIFRGKLSEKWSDSDINHEQITVNYNNFLIASYNYVADQTPEYFWRRYDKAECKKDYGHNPGKLYSHEIELARERGQDCFSRMILKDVLINKEIDDAAKDWLRFSLDREGDRKQKRVKKNNINNNDTVEIQIEEGHTRGDDQ
ncbi:unnamed protein product [Mytilus edulis]|uniref:Uncharacterized protein n=1 Tax=Mytilus edulis TaxID=6550 RepID=A0A8S3U4S5_MYTED|nr:unnamed protein product [Mytilus edulis]